MESFRLCTFSAIQSSGTEFILLGIGPTCWELGPFIPQERGHMELWSRAARGEGARWSPLPGLSLCEFSNSHYSLVARPLMKWLLGVLFITDGLGPDQSLHTEAAPVDGADGVLPGGDQGERPLQVPTGEPALGGQRQAWLPTSKSSTTLQTSGSFRTVPSSELSRYSFAQIFQKT